MTDNKKSNIRPSYHISAWQNWLNDPNGLVFYQGEYHAFYQNNPAGHEWGPMHWGHVVSKDLYRWEHKPIALFPDAEGTCFSGSALVDHDNISNLAPEGSEALLLFYTHHRNDGTEEQYLAYSLDGEEFFNYKGNPIISNSKAKRPDFRDPKVFYYSPDSSWRMLLSVGDHVEFYRSADLLSWQYDSSFGPLADIYPGVWECADLFDLDFAGQKYWLLLLSLAGTKQLGGGKTFYFVGDYDGHNFLPLEGSAKPRLIDHGMDNYAGVSFAETKEKIMLAWSLNGIYAPDSPTIGFCGQFCGPRLPFLYKDKNANISAGFRPYSLSPEIKSEKLTLSCVPNNSASNKGTLSPTDSFAKYTYRTNLNSKPVLIKLQSETDADLQTYMLKLKNDHAEEFVLYKNASGQIVADRSKAMGNINSEVFALDTYNYASTTSLISADGAVNGKLEIFYDAPLLEIYADGGTSVFTMVLYPEHPLEMLEINTNVKPLVAELETFRAQDLEKPYKFKANF